MKKVFLFFLLFVSCSTLYGAYDVRLGIFKNNKDIRSSINKIESLKYRNKVIINKKRKRYHVHAIIDGDITEAKRALKVYRRVFKNAFFQRSKTTGKKIVKKTQSKKRNEKKKPLSVLKNYYKKQVARTKKVIMHKR